MDQTSLEARRSLLLKERDALLHNLSAYDGALQEVEFWLQRVSKQVEQDVTNVVQDVLNKTMDNPPKLVSATLHGDVNGTP